MQITRLIIENLRAIERLELKLADDAGQPRRRVVLIGANGVGKTTILDAIAHAFCSLRGLETILGNVKVLGAADVRNIQDPLLESGAPLRRGAVVLDAVLSDEERRKSQRTYPKSPSAGPLRFEIGADTSQDLFSFDEVEAPPTDTDDMHAPRRSPEVDVYGVEQDQEDLVMSFEGAARAALSEARAPCLLLPADRGVLEPSDDLTLRQIRTFDPRIGCLSRSRERFAPIAAHLALAAIARDSEESRSVERMWKVLAKYFPALPQPLAGADGFVLRFRNERGATVPLTALSEGERAVLLIFGECALRSPKDALILIDEIEQHLHPRWQRAALEGLVALLPSAQFIFTTQSPYLAACAPDDVVVLGDWKSDGQ